MVANFAARDEQSEPLPAPQSQSLLRFLTCGSVDDGKSTLIGRLLYDTKALHDDQLQALESDSKKVGTNSAALDFALLVDGLAAEREQGITIDVAYRFFATPQRKFIVADTPGHEQYTRNMVTGASTADLAIILIDARKGVLTQTQRHSYLVSLLGIREVVLAVNKMDLVGYEQSVFDEIVSAYRSFAAQIGLERFCAIPLAALHGENLTRPSQAMGWYRGPTLLDHLEQVDVARDEASAPFRLPVQWVNRPNSEFRGFSGLIAAGTIRPGDRIRALPSGRESTVTRVLLDRDLGYAVAGQSITVTLADEIDVSRGDMLCAASAPAATADQFQATLVWMAETPMLPGRPYLVKIGAKTVAATISATKHKINVNTLEHLAARTLELNEIGVCNLSLAEPIAFDPYAENRETGGFILIDRMSNETVGAGLIQFALQRAQNIPWQKVDVTKRARAEQKLQLPCVLWFTGLSGAGKSSIANLVEKKLFAHGRHTYLLDGDNVRHGLNRDLGFADSDRVENIRRLAEVARLMADAGLFVLVSSISPFRAERRMARDLMPEGEFLEIFIDAPLHVVEARDPKGLYAKARRGEIEHFTGFDSTYETPEAPEIHIDTTEVTAEQAADRIVEALMRRGLLGADVDPIGAWI